MKKSILIFAGLIILLGCNKQPVTTSKSTPPKTSVKDPSYSANKLAGTYKCILKGTIDMTCVQNTYKCYIGHRNVLDTFTCTIGKYQYLSGNSYDNNQMAIDSIWGSEITIALTSDTTFKGRGLIYDPKNCKVGLNMGTQMDYATAYGDSIVYIHNGNVNDSFHTVKSHLVCTMIKQ